MDLNFLVLDGYGQFVWPAFIFTVVSCFVLYAKTKKEFKKQEKIYLQEYKKLNTQKINTIKREEITTEALSKSSTRAFQIIKEN